MNIGQLTIRMAADVARLRTDMNESRRIVESATDRMSRAANTARMALGSIGVGVGVKALAVEYLRIADSVTTLNNQLKLSHKSIQDQEAAYKGLFKVANQARVSVSDLGGTYASIARNGGPQTQVLAVTKAIANAMLISGGSQQSMNAALVQFGQGMASGTLRGEELNSVMEQMPRLAKAIADGMGITIGKLREYGAEGKITFDVVTQALLSQASVLETEVAGATMTAAQAYTVMGNAATFMIGEVDKATDASGLWARTVAAIAAEMNILGEVVEASSAKGESGLMSMTNALGAFLGRATFGSIESIFESFNWTLNALTGNVFGFSESISLMPDNLKPMSEQMQIMISDLEAARAEYDALEARLARAPDNIYVKSDMAQLSLYIAKLEEATQKQRQFLAALGTGAGLDTRNEDARFARQNAALAAAAAAAAAKPPKKPRVAKDNTAEKAAKEAARLRQQEIETEAAMRQILIDKDREWAEEAAAAEDKVRQAMADRIETAQEAAQTAQERLKQQVEENEEIGLTAKQLAELEYARSMDAAAALERRAVLAADIDFSGKLSEAYRAEAEAIRGIAVAKQEGAVKKAEVQVQKEQQQEWVDMWKSVDQTAHDVFVNIGEEGQDAFKRIGKTLKAAVLDMLYQMTVKKWIFQISGSMGGGAGGGINWFELASQAYSRYTGGGGAGSGAGSLLGGGGSAAAAANTGVATSPAYAAGGGTYAAATVSDSAMISTASTTTSTGAGTSMMGYMSYAALIAAAVMIASNLYDKGYTRMALGEGGSETAKFGQFSSYETDPSVQKSWMNNGIMNLMAKDMRKVYDSLGMSEKWADIFSGTARMATLIGRKLSAFGYQADIAGGDSEVSGFARYKGGVLRSNKTVKADVDPRDAAAFDAVVENTIEGSKAMARALGLSDEAINAYTGSLKVNFKGATTAEEQAKRVAEAMDDLQKKLIQAASGGKMSGEEFKKFMEGVNKAMEGVGITSKSMADIITQGMIGRLSQEQVGEQLSEMVIGGIYNTLASPFAMQISEVFNSQILQPVFAAIMSGVPISQAVSAASIAATVQAANQAAANLSAIFNDPSFRAAIAGIQEAIKGISFASVKPAKQIRAYGTAMSAAGQAAKAAAEERFRLEGELLNLLGNTARIRERELAALAPANRALQKHIWALEDTRTAMDDALEGVRRAIDAEREKLEKELDAANELESTLNDVFGILRDNIKELRNTVDDTATMQYLQAQETFAAMLASNEPIKPDELEDVIEALRRGLDDTVFTTLAEQELATSRLANSLQFMQDGVQPQLSAAEEQVVLLEEQLANLDVQLKVAEDSVNALLGIDASVKTVTNAVDALSISMSQYTQAVAAASAITVSTIVAATTTAPVSSGTYGGGGGGGGTSSKWTADGYWAKNPDLQREFANGNLSASPQFNKDPNLTARDEYLAWHWAHQGQAERRKFGVGGTFTNGIVSRPTQFNIGEMGEAGAEGILPLTNVGGRLGVHAMGGADEETKELLRQVLEEMTMTRENSEGIAINTGRTTAMLRRVVRDDHISVATDDDNVIATQEIV